MPHSTLARHNDRSRRRQGPGTLHAPAPDGRPGRRTVSATELFDAALDRHTAGLPVELWIVGPAGRRPLPLARWCAGSGACEPSDALALEALRCAVPAKAAVLDLGCGPGRHTSYLTDRGLDVLGVDTSRTAVALTRARGGRARWGDGLSLPPDPDGAASTTGGWDAVLLLDGNIGIGGDPHRLLRRVCELLTPTGRLLVELDADGVTDAGTVRLSDGMQTSAGFAWARLGRRDLPAAAGRAGLQVLRAWTADSREFALVGPVLS